MCVAVYGAGNIPKSVSNPMKKDNPANWLELCSTILFERIVGYNAEKMQDMMFGFMLKNTNNPIDFLYKEFRTKDSAWFSRK